MAHDTVVLKLDRAEQEKLSRDVRAGEFELKHVDHAQFSARGEGVTATLYASGKLVVQGAGAALFVERFVGRSPESSASPASPIPKNPSARGLAAEQAAEQAPAGAHVRDADPGRVDA